jgi:hypothetical protein
LKTGFLIPGRDFCGQNGDFDFSAGKVPPARLHLLYFPSGSFFFVTGCASAAGRTNASAATCYGMLVFKLQNYQIAKLPNYT